MWSQNGVISTSIENQMYTSTHLLLPDQVRSIEKILQAVEQAADKSGSNSVFHCNVFPRPRQTLLASLLKSYYELFVLEKSCLKKVFTIFNAMNCVLNVKNEQGKHQMAAKEIIKKELFPSSGIACMLSMNIASKVFKRQDASALDTKTCFQAGPQVSKFHPRSTASLRILQLRNASSVLQD